MKDLLVPPALLLATAAFVLAGCASSGGNTAARAAPVASIQDVMQIFVDPAADSLWDSVSTTITRAGVEENRPVTAADWEAQRRLALRLVEGANLLMLPGRPVADHGKALEDAQLAAVLPAAAIEARIAANPGRFEERAFALKAAARQALQAVRAKDVQLLLRAGSALDDACERCHLLYWYPDGGPPPARRPAPG
jgi:hypothetical protein